MALPSLTPISISSKSILPSTGSSSEVNNGCSFKIYSDPSSELYSQEFLSGAIEQVTFTYRKLGGDILDIELLPANIYSSYEEAVLEYSYIINMHQSKNIMSTVLGNTTGTFDHRGQLQDGDLKNALSGSQVALSYTKFRFTYAENIFKATSNESLVNYDYPEYSASVDIIANQQDYNLQHIVSSASLNAGYDFSGIVGNKKIKITRVFYKTPIAQWRFFGYYGGINAVGNLQSYGQWADDSNFEIVPVWQNKAQARAFKDSVYTRFSHYSYELKNNRIRFFPVPGAGSPNKMWFNFIVEPDSWGTNIGPGVTSGSLNSYSDTTLTGINNMNTIPFSNIPYENINSIGKMWIRRYALALSMETLGYIRTKYSTLPIPGSEITLNGAELISQGKAEQEKLKDELKETLNDLTYDKLMSKEAQMAEDAANVAKTMPSLIFIG